MSEEKLRTLLILNQRWPRSVSDYNVVGDRVEVIGTQRKVITVISTAELERMKFEWQRHLDRTRKGFLTLQWSIYWSIILIKFVLPAAITLLGIYFAIRFFQ